MSVYVARVSDGAIVPELKGHRDGVDAVEFCGDGRLLAKGSRDRTVRIWQRAGETLEEVFMLSSLSGPVVSVRFSPDVEKLAVLIKNELAVRVWDLAVLWERLAGMGMEW